MMLSHSLYAAPSKFAYQGQIIKPNGQALEASNVSFTIQLLSPGPEECLLYQETHTLNMSGSNGVFALTIGEGARSGVSFENTSSLSEALDNTSGPITPSTCLVGLTYTPSVSDARKLRLTFDEGGGPNTIAQDHVINSVPYADSASSIDGLSSTDLLRINTAGSYVLTQANLENIFDSANHTELLALIAGTSTQYLSGTPSASFDMNAQRITNLANPTLASDATNKNYVDSNIAGLGTDSVTLSALTIGDAGEVLFWDGNQWTAGTVPGDATKLPLDGSSAMTGNLDMGGFSLSNAANMVLSNDLSVGNNATVVGDLSVAGGIGVSNGITSAGRIQLDTANEVRFMDAADTNYVGFRAPGAVTTSVIWTLPVVDGSSDDILRTDGSGGLSWVANDKVDRAGDSMTGDLNMNDEGEVRFADAGSAKYVGFKAPALVTAPASFVWELPADDGDSGQVLQTDGSGVLSWVDRTSAITGSDLSNGTFWLGDGGNQAAEVSLSGDATLANDGTLTINNNSINNARLANDAVQTANILNGNVTNSKLADNSVDSAKLSDDAVAMINIQNSVVDNSKLADNSVDSAKLADDAVLSTHITDNSIVNADINSTANIDTTKLATGAVDNTEFNYLNGVTSAIQTQLNSKATIGGDSGAVVLGSNDNTLALESNGAEALNIDINGNVGIGSSTPSSLLDVAGTIRVANGGETCTGGSNTGMIRYLGGNLDYCNGSAWQTLGVSGAGLTNFNGETGSSQSLAVDGNGLAPTWTSNTNTHTLSIPLASGAGVTSGTMSKAQFDDFDQKLDPTLTDGQILVGSGGNVATGVAMSGDATLINDGTLTISANAIDSGKLANSAVATINIQDNAVDSDKLSADAVATIHIQDNAVDSAKIADDAVGTLQIADNSIVNADISSSAGIDAAKLADGSVSSTEYQYLDGVTSNIQTQMDGKVNDTGDTITGTVLMDDENEIHFGDSGSAKYVGFKAPASITAPASFVWELPADDGDSGQVLQTNGSGVLSWVDSTSAITGSALSNGTLWLGDAGNQAAEVTLGGDASLANNGTLTINNNAINNAKLADDAVQTVNILNGNITNSKLADNSVTSLKILDNEIVNADIASGAAITATKIAGGSVDNTEFGYLDGLTSAIQTQLNNKATLGGDNGAVVLGSNDNTLSFEANDAVAMTVLANGRVGIGTASPTGVLHVYGGTSDSNIALEAGDGNASPGGTVLLRAGLDDISGGYNNVTLVGGSFLLNGLNAAGGGYYNHLRLRNTGGATTNGGTGVSFWADRSGSIVTEWASIGAITTDVSSSYKGVLSLKTANGASPIERVRIDHTGAVGIGSTAPTSLLDVAGTIRVADGGEGCTGGSNTGMIRYNSGNLDYCNGSAWQTLGISGAGLTSFNGENGSSQSLAVDGNGLAPAWTSNSNTHTLSIPLASGAGVTSGTISKAQFDDFDQKLDPSLTDG